MKKLLLFFVGVLMSISLYSQSGATCATAAILDTTSIDGIIRQTIVQQNKWYKFTALNNKVNITIFSFKGSGDEINSAKLWGGTCSSLTLIGSDTIFGATDSMLNINTSSILSGQIYYLQFFKKTNVDTGKFCVDLNFLIPPPTCASCVIPAVTCELVCNGNFETYTSLPTLQDQIYKACPWVKANISTPDFLHVGGAGGVTVPGNTFGSQSSTASGSGYAGIVARVPVSGTTSGAEKEIFYQLLKDTLIACETYSVSMKVSLADYSRFSVNFLGMYLSTTDPYMPTTGSITSIPAQTVSSPIHITNKTTWVTISNPAYIAVGGETYIAIGCFGGSLAPLSPPPSGYSIPIAYYYIDSVTVTHVINPVASATPSLICSGDTSMLTVGGICNTTGILYNWVGVTTNDTAYVTPTDTTEYFINLTDQNGCTGVDSITVNVNPKPVITAIANDTVCNGSTVASSSFTSTPAGATFTWTNSNPAIGLSASGSVNTPSFTATNSGTTYISGTIQVIASLNGCLDTIQYTITVVPTPNAFVPLGVTICNGDTTGVISFSSTVTGTTFTWTNSNTAIGLGASGNGSIPNFTGTNGTTSPISGTITVTPTANGCVGTPSIFTITINPTPTVIVTPPSPVIPFGGSVTLTASGASTYLWSTGAITNSITVSPSVTTTYTVTGTNSYGCKNDTTVTVTVVPPACLIPLNYDVPAGSNVTSAFPGFPTGLSGKTIRIDGIFTIDVPNFAFSACNIIMMPNASIVVPSNTILQLTNKTHMFSCDSMWDGIFVLAGGNLLVNSNSMIEDGKKAINIASGGFASVIESIFNRNYTSIELTSNAGVTSPLNINNCVFTSRNIPTAANPTANPVTATVKSNVFSLTPPPTWFSYNMKAPYSTIKSINGINSTDVNILNIGSAISIYNGFENIGCGIRLSNGTLSTASIAIISGNRFQNMVNGSGCFLCPSLLGTGISATGTATGDNRILVGGNLTSEGNQFRNTFTAVEIVNYKQARAINNTITNTTTMSPMSIFGFGRIGIIIRPSLNNTLRVANNSVTNCANGIWINRSLNGINTTSILVEDNAVNANSSGYCSNGIAVSDVINTGSTTAIDKIKIRNNSVNQAFNCVSITNVKNGLIVYQNPNLVVRNDGINLGNGIRLQNCKSVRVHNNPNITVSPLTTPVTSTSINYKGIQVITSPESWVSCNKIFSMGESMTYVGNCANSSIFDNQMTSGNRAFVLRNNGEVGQQLTPTIPCGNYWSAGGSFAFQTYTDNTTTANLLSKLYVNNVGTPGGHTHLPTSNFGSGAPITFYSTSLGGINAISNAFLPIPCASVAIFLAPAPGGSPSLAKLQSLATDNNSYPVYENSNRFHRKKYAFEILDADSGASADTSVVLQDFYDSTQVASLGILSFADKSIVQNDYVNAETNNTSVYANNIMEQNQKLFNSLYLLLLNNDSYEYTTSEKADLYSIASQCHLEGGNAVWQARVLVWTIENDIIEFADNCNEEPRSMTIINNTTSDYSANFNVYPNPNMGAMELSYSLNVNEIGIFEVYDISGKQIMGYSLDKNSNKLKIENKELSAGVYYYNIRINEKVVKTEKLIIVK